MGKNKDAIDNILGDVDEMTTPAATATATADDVAEDVEVTEPGDEVANDNTDPTQIDDVAEAATETVADTDTDTDEDSNSVEQPTETTEITEEPTPDDPIISVDLANTEDIAVIGQVVFHTPTKPVTIYKTNSTRCPICNCMNRLVISGRSVNGYLKVSTMIPGYGRVNGYVADKSLPSSIVKMWDVSDAH